MSKKIFHFLYIFCLFSTISYAGNIYVATTGSDSAPNDGSIGKPYLTINKAAQVAVAGDVVIIKSGTYLPTSSIIVANEGTSIAPITFMAEVIDGVIIDGSASSTPNATNRQGLFMILGTTTNYKSWIVIDGLRVINSKWAGIFAQYSDNIIVKNCSTNNTWASGIIAANSSNIKVLNNKVQQACIHPETVSRQNTNECITMASVATFEVAYNSVSDRLTDTSNGGEGIDAKNNCSNGTFHHNTVTTLTRVGIYIDAYTGNISNIEVYDNKVSESDGGGITIASEAGGIVDGVKVHDNLVYNNKRFGIRIAGYLGDGPIKNIDIYQNTVVNCGFSAGTWENVGLLIEAKNTTNTGFNIRNNIFSGCPFQVRANNQTFPYVLDNNLLFGSTAVSGTNAITTDPKFLNVLAKDFRLDLGSPAIDVAVGSPVSTRDYADVSRPLGAATDLGAFEYYPTQIWTGTTSTDFNLGTNWKTGAIPNSSIPITIYPNLTNYPVISVNTSIAGGMIATGASLTVNEGKVLTNTGALTNDGNLILKSSTAGTASLLSIASINNVTQQRYLSSNQRGWRLLSNPLSTTTFNTLATASGITIGINFTGEYQSATNTWTSTDGNANMTTQQPYKIFITGLTGEAPNYTTGPSNVTLVNKGTAANTVPATINTIAGKYYLVANPYTAPLSVSSIIGASTNLSNTVSYYNPTIGSTDVKIKFGGYNTPTVSGIAGSATDVVIPPMGAIFVLASSNGTINVPKSAIFTGIPAQTGTYNHKLAQTKVAQTNGLKVEVSSNGTYYDTVAFKFKTVEDTGSNIDFGKLPNTILDAYSLVGSEKMAVSELELAAQTIPLGITSSIQKNYTFKVVENTIPAGYEAVLVDNELNTSTVLAPETNYSFAIDSTPASQGDARFSINLKTAGSLGVKANELDSKIQLWPNPARGQFNITNAQNAKEGISTIEISTVNGQVIYSQKSNPDTTTTIQTNGWAKGVYILKMTNNGTQTTKKLIIQ